MPEGFRFCAKLPRAGKRPLVYLHTPDNRLAPELAMRFHEQLSGRLPGLPPLAAPPMQTDQSHLSLLGVAGEG